MNAPLDKCYFNNLALNGNVFFVQITWISSPTIFIHVDPILSIYCIKQGCYRIFMNDCPDFSIKYSVFPDLSLDNQIYFPWPQPWQLDIFPRTSALTTRYISPDLSLDNQIYFPWPQPWQLDIFPRTSALTTRYISPDLSLDN